MLILKILLLRWNIKSSFSHLKSSPKPHKSVNCNEKKKLEEKYYKILANLANLLKQQVNFIVLQVLIKEKEHTTNSNVKIISYQLQKFPLSIILCQVPS